MDHELHQVSMLNGFIFSSFYHAMHLSALHCTATPRVCQPLTFVNCDYWRWRTSKIITQLITLGTWLATTTNPSLGEVRQFSDERQVGCEKAIFFGRNLNISPKWCDIEQNLHQNVGINLHIP